MAERETKKQRKDRIRETRGLELQQTHGRQRWQKIGLATGITLVMLLSGGLISNFIQHPQGVVNPGEDLKIADEEEAKSLVQKRAEQLGITKDQAEINLWQGVNSEIKQSEIAGTLTAGKKLNIVTSAMGNSGNLYLKQAADFLNEQVINGRLSTRIEPSFKNAPGNNPAEKTSEFMFVQPIINNNNLGISVVTSAEQVLAKSALETALSITHEMKHGKNMLDADTSQHGKNMNERFQYQINRIRTLDERSREEADAYNEESRAYINQFGLMGGNLIYSDRLGLAATSILVNNNPTDPRWIRFILQYYVVSLN